MRVHRFILREVRCLSSLRRASASTTTGVATVARWAELASEVKEAKPLPTCSGSLSSITQRTWSSGVGLTEPVIVASRTRSSLTSVTYATIDDGDSLVRTQAMMLESEQWGESQSWL